jgi:hypothetical protein
MRPELSPGFRLAAARVVRDERGIALVLLSINVISPTHLGGG